MLPLCVEAIPDTHLHALGEVGQVVRVKDVVEDQHSATKVQTRDLEVVEDVLANSSVLQLLLEPS